MWNEDIVPATTIIRDRSRTPLHVMQEMLLGKLDLQSGWEAPDVRFMRQDGSDAYVDGNGIIVWMPKDDTFFARNHLKVCCITFKEYLVHEWSNQTVWLLVRRKMRRRGASLNIVDSIHRVGSQTNNSQVVYPNTSWPLGPSRGTLRLKIFSECTLVFPPIYIYSRPNQIRHHSTVVSFSPSHTRLLENSRACVREHLRHCVYKYFIFHIFHVCLIPPRGLTRKAETEQKHCI